MTTRPAKKPLVGTRSISEYLNRAPPPPPAQAGRKRTCSAANSLVAQKRDALMQTSLADVCTESLTTGMTSRRDTPVATAADKIIHDVIEVVLPSRASSMQSSSSSSHPLQVAGSQESGDLLESDSDDDLPSFFASNSFKPAAKPTLPKSVSAPELDLAGLLRDKAEGERKQAERARVAALLAETAAVERHEKEREIMNEDAEKKLGTETAGKLRGALKRIGADMRAERGYRCFVGGQRREREFDVKWIDGIDWLEGFDNEVERNDLVCGLVKDMIALGEKLPREVVLWCMQHVAFERSEILAFAYSDVFVLSIKDINPSAQDLDSILFHFGMDDNLTPDTSEIKASTGDDVDLNVNLNIYGLLTVASAFGQLPTSLPSETIKHAIILLMKMAMDSTVGEDLHETVEAALSILLQSLDDESHSTLLSSLTEIIPEKHLQLTLLSRLPVQPIRVAQFRQNLSKSFLHIPLSPPSALLDCLRTDEPFTFVNRDITNEEVRQLRYATLIYEIAFDSQEPRLTEDVIVEFREMYRMILDDRAVSMARTETKDVIQRTWITFKNSLPATYEMTNTIEQFWA